MIIIQNEPFSDITLKKINTSTSVENKIKNCFQYNLNTSGVQRDISSVWYLNRFQRNHKMHFKVKFLQTCGINEVTFNKVKLKIASLYD